ncbi:hypothetical protein [Actinomadura decatromicini]|uniref:Uncharacterized protein n=1 Tax=Actinomadura decatromicini TaxID=2604572 RepID=A0A5D3FZ66_9ACTN|nr:hypothetical protein [Actinomadura decatromicini]TYK53020.1 hypothetical protein FXF68_04590 [Actinomadura decatromicini]
MNDAHSGKAGSGAGSGEHGEHGAGFVEIGLECPVSCLGVRTIGDLVRLLAEAGRAAGLYGVGLVGEPLHEHERVTPACPIACMGVSERVLAPLRRELGEAAMVGEVVALLLSGELAEVRGIGPRRVGEVRTALIAEGFPVAAGQW